MKRVFSHILALFVASGALLADGLIIVHEPIPTPGPVVPPYPGPRPPRPLPPPRPTPRPFTFAPLEVTFHRVEAKVRDQVATTSVDQEFFNPNDRQLEGTYIFPIPKGAQIDKFSMDVNGRPMEAELLPADKARQIYEDIVRRHRDPALLEYVGRDLFKVRIFPIEARSKKRVQLNYTQLLKADSGLVSYLYPLNTEKYSARPIPTVSLRLELETQRPLASIYSPSHAVDIKRDGGNRATVGFESRDAQPNTDFQLFFATEKDDLGVNLLTYRAAGEDGYFLLLAAPRFDAKDIERRILPKDVVFVLDTSGSMAGKKLEQAKKALQFCVQNLNDQDRFEILRFATEVEPRFNRLVDATPANREQADRFIQELKPIGGTAIHDALKRAFSTRPDPGERPCFIIFLTDGLPTVGPVDNDSIVAMAQQAGGGKTRVFCFGIGNDVNTHLLDRITETTRATSAYVLPDEDLEVKLSNFFSKIKDPVLANVTLTFPEAVRVTKLYPSPLPDLFRGEQLVLVGRYSGTAEGTIALGGAVDGATQVFRFPAAFGDSAGKHEFIPRLWATRRIGYLLDEIRLRGENAELRDEVADLARRHGIVTPYTAFLIHEDEQRRGIPLAQQSLPQLQLDTTARRATEMAFQSYRQDMSGAAAVASARYGLAQKSADQVGESLHVARAEAARALSAAAPTPAPVAPPPAGIAGRRPSVGGIPAAHVPTTAETAAKVVAYTEQTRFVGGRSFFQNGDRWIDTGVRRLRNPTTTRVQFDSPEYFNLVAAHPEAGPWLALGTQVQFVLGETVYEVHE